MERRMRRKSHVRCGVGENPEITSKDYLSLSDHKFFSFEDFAKQLAVHQRKYNDFPMRPLNWRSPKQVLFAFPNV